MGGWRGEGGAGASLLAGASRVRCARRFLRFLMLSFEGERAIRQGETKRSPRRWRGDPGGARETSGTGTQGRMCDRERKGAGEERGEGGDWTGRAILNEARGHSLGRKRRDFRELEKKRAEASTALALCGASAHFSRGGRERKGRAAAALCRAVENGRRAAAASTPRRRMVRNRANESSKARRRGGGGDARTQRRRFSRVRGTRGGEKGGGGDCEEPR